jgi:hypothetical protein
MVGLPRGGQKKEEPGCDQQVLDQLKKGKLVAAPRVQHAATSRNTKEGNML